MLVITAKIRIPLKELEFSYVRSSGPGGQKTNKTSSQAQLRWSILKSKSLSDLQKDKVRRKLKHRINTEDEIIISSSRFRDRGRNVADCIEKLRGLLQKALYNPKKRIPTSPTSASREKRLQDKKKQSDKKRQRSKKY